MKKKIISNQKESICIITINKGPKGTGFGTGFLCSIGLVKKIKSLVTANHILDEDQLKIGKEIKITFNDDKNSKIIKMDGSRRIYANEKDDITIIEIKDNDKLNDYDALEIDSNIYKDLINSYDEYNNKIVYILHYPEGNFVIFSKNIIIDIDNNNNIYHSCANEVGSSGSPMLNLDTLKVIGMHRGYDNFNKERFHNETIMKFQNDFDKENKLKCNIGKIMKESIINFNKESKIILTVKINEDDIGKKIYFLQNHLLSDYGHRINLKNFVILINDNIYESKNYFIAKTAGIYIILKYFLKILFKIVLVFFMIVRTLQK